MRILIIGGTGLISSAITHQLLQGGHDVTLYTRGERSLPAGVAHLVGDRRDRAGFVRQLASAGSFDCAIDMICYRPDEAEGLIEALRGRVRQLIFCSTVDVYARPVPAYPIREDAPLGGVSSYGQDKARCEQILQAAHARGDLAVTTIRPAQTYGDTGGLINPLGFGTRFLDRLRRGRPVIVHGDGTSLWVACHVDDVARAIVGAVANPASLGRAYHVTGEEWLTWDMCVQLMAAALDAPAPQIVHIPTDLLLLAAPERARITAENFQFTNIFDTSAARADLGFRYTIRYAEGMRRVVAALDRAGRIEPDDDPLQDQLIAAWQQTQRQYGVARLT